MIWNSRSHASAGADSDNLPAARFAAEMAAVRNAVGIFDASPLGKIEVAGPDAADFLSRFYVSNLATLQPGRSAQAVVDWLAQHGILSWTTAADQVRFVTHLDVSREDTREIAEIVRKARI